MIRHTVSFTLKFPKGSAAEQDFLNATLVLKNIPGVTQFERLRQKSNKNPFDFGLSMQFATLQDYEAYNSHPLHTAFVQQHWIPDVKEFLEADFEGYE